MEPKVLSGRYEMIRPIGSGGMGTVWRARDRSLGREVAVKLLHEGLASDTAFAERFRREARSAAGLAHPNIVTVYDSGEDATGGPAAGERIPFIVMELVEGTSLRARLQDGPLSVREAVRLARAVLSALGHAHGRGLVHRDMKPGNVLLAGGDVKVVDFGIAKAADESSDLTRTGALLGTAAFLSPEQASGHPATPASDLYALGCLLYNCLVGTPPFDGDSPVAVALRHTRDPVPPIRSRRPEVPEALDRVVMRALEKEPSRRFPSAAEMDAALAALDDATLPDTIPALTVPIPSADVAAPQRTEELPAPRRRTARSGRFLGVLAAALLAAAAIWLLATYFASRGPGFLDTPLPDGSPRSTQETEPTPTASPSPPPQQNLPLPDLPGIDFGGD